MSETPTVETTFLKNLWDAREAAALESRPLELLRYRSNLLGADLRITNFGGGNPSSKLSMTDPFTGGTTTVLAVKGSGGAADIAKYWILLQNHPNTATATAAAQ